MSLSIPGYVNNTNCFMPLDWQTTAHEQIELWIIGVILSAMVYGGALSLTLTHLPLLLKSSYDISRRMRIFLLVYVTIMLAMSTVYIITIIIAVWTSVPVGSSNDIEFCGLAGISPDWFQNGYAGGFCITFASWGADGFMLWRCAMLYEGISRPRRIALLSVLGVMGLMSFGSGVALPSLDGFYFFLAITGITVFLNLVTATLITFRILYFDNHFRKTVGLERNSPYMTVITICVESSALIVVVGLIYLILYFKANNASLIPLQLLVHAYVISPLLIVYRVARGRAATIRQRPSQNDPVVSALCFEPPPPPPLSSSKNEV